MATLKIQSNLKIKNIFTSKLIEQQNGIENEYLQVYRQQNGIQNEYLQGYRQSTMKWNEKNQETVRNYRNYVNIHSKVDKNLYWQQQQLNEKQENKYSKA